MAGDPRVQEVLARALAEVAGARSTSDLEQVRVRVLGRSGQLTTLLRSLGSVPAAERPRIGEQTNRAKVTVRFKGREMAHTELGWKMLNKMVEGMSDIAVIENHPRMEGRMLSMILSPKPH